MERMKIDVEDGGGGSFYEAEMGPLMLRPESCRYAPRNVFWGTGLFEHFSFLFSEQ